MPDHEPLDPNVPHPDIPDIRVHQGSICEIGGILFLAGFSAGSGWGLTLCIIAGLLMLITSVISALRD